jgi:hypothetical protein
MSFTARYRDKLLKMVLVLIVAAILTIVHVFLRDEWRQGGVLMKD